MNAAAGEMFGRLSSLDDGLGEWRPDGPAEMLSGRLTLSDQPKIWCREAVGDPKTIGIQAMHA
jgi:hypothetical protein